MRNFGGIATSRLNRNLRLDKHWSYGTTAAMPASRGPRPFYVVAPVQTDKTKEAMVEVAKELRGIAGERPMAGEEFQSIMRNQTLGLPGRFESLDALERGHRHRQPRLPDDYYANYAKNVRALDEKAPRRRGAVFIRPDEIVWLVVGDLEKVEAGIRELKLARRDPAGRERQVDQLNRLDGWTTAGGGGHPRLAGGSRHGHAGSHPAAWALMIGRRDGAATLARRQQRYPGGPHRPALSLVADARTRLGAQAHGLREVAGRRRAGTTTTSTRHDLGAGGLPRN